MLIAMDIESHLIDNGYEVAGPCAKISDAQALVGEGLAAAILDINLRDGQSFDFAKQLLSKNIPPIFISGAIEHDLPAGLDGRPILVKPLSFPGLLSVLESEISKFS